ncbi:YhgE/Pip domain-containing protein [Streptomyces sp. NPDC017448]|uniref:YhgE/Pip domain-containing protein n=1 Tax=Streptomyces sp. NPDC017448 TaxID=3364996 RepID=UPI0037BA1B73
MTSERHRTAVDAGRLRALLGRPKLWLVPGLLTALVALVLSLLYMGGILNPEDRLHKFPVALVNEDAGRPLPGADRNLGALISAQVIDASSSDEVRWRQLDTAELEDELASGKVYGALVIPKGFTDDVRSLGGRDATRPTLTVLTNPGMGSFGSSFASRIAQQAAQKASTGIGKQLSSSPAFADAGAAENLLLDDPVAVVTRTGHPIGDHSGLGLSAFYYTLLLVLAGFLGGNIIHNGVDTALGYADAEIGPWHTRHRTVPVNRTETLLLKSAMTAVLCLPMTALVMLACITVLGMDASHVPLLALFSYCSCLSVGLGVQAINAAFGSIGQIVSMFVFIALALPSSGATIPLEAVPGFYRFLGAFEPMRQLVSGVRAILYFDARADAGLARAWIMLAVGFVLALVFGFLMTRYYDRKGLHRMVPQPS